ncbi:Ig domain-containing protein, partial [Harryflintia acetispora]
GITISAAAATVTVGKTTALSATVTPANAFNTNVTWKSSNPAVATVSPASTASGANVTITGVAAGSATITATAAGNTNCSASCTVTVQPAYPKDDSGNNITSSRLGQTITWAGRSWWVIDAGGSQYGGKTNSVVLLANFNYTSSIFGGNNTYSGSTVRAHCSNFYNSLTAAQRRKLSPHKYVGDYAWLPSAYEIYGSSKNNVGWAGDLYEIPRQFSYLSKNSVTSANYNLVKSIYGGSISWLRSPNSKNSSVGVDVAAAGTLSTDYLSSSDQVRPAVILNP